MLNYLPQYTFIGAGVSSTADGTTTLTVPEGANGVLIQVFTAAVKIEFGGGALNANSLQLLSGLNPVLIRLGSGSTFKLGQVTSGATAVIRYVKTT